MLFRKFKSSSDNFLDAMDFLRRACRRTGVDLFDKNHKLCWRTYFLLITGVAYFILIFQTMYFNYKEDWTIILKGAATLGSGVQGIFKLTDFLLKRRNISNLYQLVIDIYKENEKLGIGYRKGLNDAANMTRQALYVLSVLYWFGAFGMIALSITSHIITGNHDLIIQFHIPGLDIHTKLGYYITIAIQTFIVIYFVNSLFCGDAGAMMFLLQAYVFSNLFEAKIEYINEIIENPGNSKKPEVNKALNDIIEWHQLYNR